MRWTVSATHKDHHAFWSLRRWLIEWIEMFETLVSLFAECAVHSSRKVHVIWTNFANKHVFFEISQMYCKYWDLLILKLFNFREITTTICQCWLKHGTCWLGKRIHTRPFWIHLIQKCQNVSHILRWNIEIWTGQRYVQRVELKRFWRNVEQWSFSFKDRRRYSRGDLRKFGGNCWIHDFDRLLKWQGAASIPSRWLLSLPVLLRLRGGGTESDGTCRPKIHFV